MAIIPPPDFATETDRKHFDFHTAEARDFEMTLFMNEDDNGERDHEGRRIRNNANDGCREGGKKVHIEFPCVNSGLTHRPGMIFAKPVPIKLSPYTIH